MGKNLIPDYQPQDGSYQVGGGDWRYGQDMVGLALDSMLTGSRSVDGVSDSNSALAPFEQMLYNLPLPVLRMFRPFTFGTPDSDWDDQYTAVQDIMATFQPKVRFKDWLDKTFGPWKTALEAKQEANRQAWQDWVDKTFGPWKTAWEAKVDAREAARQEWLANVYQPWKDALEAKQDAREAAWQEWLNKTFPNWMALQDAREKAWQDWVAKTFGPWRDAQDANKQKWQDWLDRTFTPWHDKQEDRQTKWQEFLDGLAGILKPGATNSPIKDALDSIFGIRDSATAAQEAADRANIGIAAIRAEQAGGTSDEFNYASAADLPSVEYLLRTTGSAAGSYGPDGAGVLVYKPQGLANAVAGTRVFIRKDHPLSTPTAGSVATVLTKAPHQNLLAPAAALLVGKASLTDEACVRAYITTNKLSIDIVNAAGVEDKGTQVSVHTVDGDAYELRWDATNAWLLRNNIEVCRRTISTAVTDAGHRQVGLGALIPSFTVLAAKNNPCPHFAGLAWHG